MPTLSKNNLVTFVFRRLHPSYYEFKCEEMKQQKDYQQLSLVFFGDRESSGYSTLTRTSMANMEWLFVVTPAECAEEYGVTANSFVLFRNFDEKKIVYTGAHDPKSVLKWLDFYRIPIYSMNLEKF